MGGLSNLRSCKINLLQGSLNIFEILPQTQNNFLSGNQSFLPFSDSITASASKQKLMGLYKHVIKTCGNAQFQDSRFAYIHVCGIDLIGTVSKSLWYRQTLRSLGQKIFLSAPLFFYHNMNSRNCAQDSDLTHHIWRRMERRTLSWLEGRGCTTDFPITTPAVIYLHLPGSGLVLHTRGKLMDPYVKRFSTLPLCLIRV